MLLLFLLPALRLAGQEERNTTYTGSLEVARLHAALCQSVITTDYGGGTWYYDAEDKTSTDDTGTVFVTTARQRFKRVIDGPVNAKWFGAKGDGLSDDRPFLQAAVNYLVSKGGGTLYIPKGTYIVTGDIRLSTAGPDKGTGYTIKGEIGTVIKKAASFAADGYIFQFRHTKNVAVESITFTGKATIPDKIAFGDNGIGFFSAAECRVSDCTFNNFGDGSIKVSSAGINDPHTTIESRRIIVTDNIFYNCIQTSTTPGGSAEYIFTNNILTHSRTKFATRYPGATSLIFSGNILDSMNNDIAPLEISGYENYIVTDNIIRNFRKSAISIYNNSRSKNSLEAKNAIISRNIICNGGGGIRIGNNTMPNGYRNVFSNITIEGNILDSIYAAPAIALVDGYFTGISIRNNHIRNYRNYSIRIAPFSDSSVQDESIHISGNIITTDTCSIRVAPGEAKSNRALSNIAIYDNTLSGPLSLEWIQKCHISNNTFNLKNSRLFLISKAENFAFRGNRLYLDQANGPYFTRSAAITFSDNTISGTSLDYTWKSGQESAARVYESGNTINGIITQSANSVNNTTHMPRPAGTKEDIYTGSASFRGNGTTTAFIVNLPVAANSQNYQVSVTPTAPIGAFFVTAKTTTSFAVKFAVAPPATDRDNIQFDWLIYNN